MDLVTVEIADFLRYLALLRIDRPVIDRTGLTGYFDIHIGYDCAPFAEPFGRPCKPDSVPFVTALQEQAGLKLEPAREMVDVLVIDSVKVPDPD